jgi:hypothetical protein
MVGKHYSTKNEIFKNGIAFLNGVRQVKGFKWLSG